MVHIKSNYDRIHKLISYTRCLPYIHDIGGSGAIASFSNCVAGGAGAAVLADCAARVVGLCGASVVVVVLVDVLPSSAEAAVEFRNAGSGVVVVEGTTGEAEINKQT